MVSPSGTPRLRMAQRRQTQHETEVFALETGMLEGGPQWRVERRFAVDAVDGELTPRAVLGQTPQGGERGRGELIEGGQGDKTFAAALHVERWLTVREHNVRARDP